MGKHTVAGTKCPLIDIEDVKMAFNCPLRIDEMPEVGRRMGGLQQRRGRVQVTHFAEEVSSSSSTSAAGDNVSTRQNRRFYCAHCDRHVFEVSTLEELNARAKRGDCVSFLAK